MVHEKLTFLGLKGYHSMFSYCTLESSSCFNITHLEGWAEAEALEVLPCGNTQPHLPRPRCCPAHCCPARSLGQQLYGPAGEPTTLLAGALAGCLLQQMV